MNPERHVKLFKRRGHALPRWLLPNFSTEKSSVRVPIPVGFPVFEDQQTF